MKNVSLFQVMMSGVLGAGFLLTVGCLTSPAVPEIPAVLQDWPEKNPLQVRLQLRELDSRTELLANSYSRRSPDRRHPVEVGHPLAETLRMGLPHLFESVEVESAQTHSQNDIDLVLTPSYRLMGSDPTGWTRQLTLIVDVQTVNPSGRLEAISHRHN